MPNLQLFLQFGKVRITDLHGYAIGHYAETMALIECCVVAFFWHDVYVKVVSVMLLCPLLQVVRQYLDADGRAKPAGSEERQSWNRRQCRV